MTAAENFLLAGPDVYWQPHWVTLDFETDTSYGDYGSAVHPENGVILASWKHSTESQVHSKWGSEFEHQELIAAVESADFIVAHNAHYELMWLKRMGVDISKLRVFCTKQAEIVLLGNLAAGDDTMPARSTSLDMCCKRRGLPVKDPVVDILIKDGVNPVRIPRAWLQGRCEQDVETTEKVFIEQRKLLQATGRLPVLYTRCIFTPVLSSVEFEGMKLDSDRVENIHPEYVSQLVKLDKEMNEITGGINWNSPKQVGIFMYEEMGFEELVDKKGEPIRNANGTYKTDKKTLEKLIASTPKQEKYIDLKRRLGKIKAALSKNLEFFLGVVRERGGVFKAKFNQAKAATHRLSSTGIPLDFEMFENEKSVQFQNLPNAFKHLFKARRAGWLIGETDGSQLEFRVAVELAQDLQGREDICRGHDVHKFTAAVMHHMPEEWINEIANRIADIELLMPRVTKSERRVSKPNTFQPVYGGYGNTKREQAYSAAFRARYPQMDSMQAGWVDEVVRTKKLVTPWGLRFYWPWARRSRSGYCKYSSNIYNYPIQCFATGEIIPIAVAFFWHRVREQGLEDKIILVNTIHDNIVCEIHPDAVEAYKEISIQAFTHDVYEYLSRVYSYEFNWVPLGVGITIGEHWTEGKELEYDVYRDGTIVDRKTA